MVTWLILSHTVLDDFDPAVSIVLLYRPSHKDVHLGNKIKPGAAGSAPDLYIDVIPSSPAWTLKPNATYVLALTDLDATSRSNPAKAQMCHWIIANISIPAKLPGIGALHPTSRSKVALTPDESGIFEIESYFRLRRRLKRATIAMSSSCCHSPLKGTRSSKSPPKGLIGVTGRLEQVCENGHRKIIWKSSVRAYTSCKTPSCTAIFY